MVAVSATFQLQNQYAQLFSDLGAFSQFCLMVKPFFLFLDTENETQRIASTGKIAFHHAGFTYPTGKEPVLHDLNFTILRRCEIKISVLSFPIRLKIRSFNSFSYSGSMADVGSSNKKKVPPW